MALISIGTNRKLMFQFDAWLTEVIEKNAYRLILGAEFSSLTLPTEACFIYCKTAVDVPQNFALLRERGFDLVDTNVVFEKNIVGASGRSPLLAHSKIRFTVPEDISQVVELARNAFVYSRFHLDNKFSKSTADKIKAEWVKNFFLGKRGNRMVVAEVGKQIVGFLLLIENKELIIDLIAVDQAFQGQGIAENMIAFAENNTQASIIRVGTQLANQPSLKFYQKIGFNLVESQYVFHFHS